MIHERLKFQLKFLIIVLFQAVGSTLSAQQQVMFTQYMFNPLALNPAYAGIHEGISASMIVREQWVGFDGAPSTQTLSLHSPVSYHPISVGGTIIMDKLGHVKQFGFYPSGAYQIEFDNAKLSFGLQGSYTNYRKDFGSSFASIDNSIESFSASRFNVGTGVLYHSNRFYFGLSVPQILSNQLRNGSGDSDANIVPHYFGMAGYVFPLKDDIILKPNVLLKWVNGAPFQFDLNLNVLLKKLIWVGLSYRSLDSFDLVLQLQLTPQIQMGYAFDFATTTDIRRVNSGSHEIGIWYTPFKGKAKTPRYF